MKFSRRRAIDPIIASLLLIAIAVAAGIIVYVFVNGLSGSLTGGGGGQAGERLQLQSYNWVATPPIAGGFTCGCSGQLLDISFINSGSASTTISGVYYDGNLIALTTPPTTAAAFPAGTSAYAVASGIYLISGTAAGDFGFSTGAATVTTYASTSTGQLVLAFSAAPQAGTTHTVKIVSLTGAEDIFTVTAGRTG